MRYIKPHYYDEFQCTADRCPDTCCAGWQIVIDDEALDLYSAVKGPFGNRLYASIDWEEGVFRQNKRRCSFLNDQNLCDLYSELGEGALCRTCSMYPRHVEEFEGLRELSLSLSCPVAAKMILNCEEPLRLIEEETEEEEELAEEFEDFDLLMFTQLEEARRVIFEIMQNRELAVEERIRLVLVMAKQMQACIDEDRYYDVEEVIEQYSRGEFEAVMTLESTGSDESESRYARMCREFTVLNRLERLRDEWSAVLTKAWSTLYEPGEAAYEEMCQKFDMQFGENSQNAEKWSIFTENLELFFILTYFCGAVYDDWIYAKAALADFSVRWIRELIMALWVRGELSEETCVEIAYRYAREIEHSDENLNMLEEWLQDRL